MLEGHILLAKCEATFPAPYGKMVVGMTWQRPDGSIYNIYSPQYREMVLDQGGSIDHL